MATKKVKQKVVRGKLFKWTEIVQTDPTVQQMVADVGFLKDSHQCLMERVFTERVELQEKAVDFPAARMQAYEEFAGSVERKLGVPMVEANRRNYKAIIDSLLDEYKSLISYVHELKVSLRQIDAMDPGKKKVWRAICSRGGPRAW